jgi:hypothetical protein
MYSQISQNADHVAIDATSDGVRIILAHQRRERYVLIGSLVLVMAFLVMNLFGGRK